MGAASVHAQPGQCWQNNYPLMKFHGDDISTTSPMLGFNTESLEHRGLRLNPGTWAPSSPCGPTGGTGPRARTASSGWWTAPIASAARPPAGAPEPVVKERLAGAPCLILPTSRTRRERCSLRPSTRPGAGLHPQTPQVHRGDPPTCH